MVTEDTLPGARAVRAARHAATVEHYAAVAGTYGANWGDCPDAYGNLYPANRIRWDFVRHRLRELAVPLGPARPLRLVEAGCGEGSPLAVLQRDGHDVCGFDLVPEMVAAAQAKVGKGLVWAGDIAVQSGWHPGNSSVPWRYDAAVALGPFPHLTDAEQRQALVAAHRHLPLGGRLFVELRNELFALWSLNRHSAALFDSLLPADTPSEVAEGIYGALALDEPPTYELAEQTERYESTYSRFNNPLTLDALFAPTGFAVRQVTYYHFHAAAPRFQTLDQEWFTRASLALEWPNPAATSWRGVLQASAFIVEAEAV